jgi:protein phosphatase 2C family protein 2/3
VDDQLAMTRAFGDGKLKEHITAEPDVMIKKIDEDTEFIILASDGLWKVQGYFIYSKLINDNKF